MSGSLSWLPLFFMTIGRPKLFAILRNTPPRLFLRNIGLFKQENPHFLLKDTLGHATGSLPLAKAPE